MKDFSARHSFAEQTCRAAGEIAARYFGDRTKLVVESKGAQDWVSEADKNVETFIRDRIAEAWPEDGIFGEEHDDKFGTSGFDWVIDPIDGTTNFVNGIPAWTIVLAGVASNKTELGVIHDPNFGETFAAQRGRGATLNGAPMQVASGIGLESGTVSVGYSNRVEAAHVVPVIADLVARGALYHRNASGALSLAYVAAGRMLGYVEEHMNAWDCLAGQLMIEEAGGVIEDQDAGEMIRQGGRVVAGTSEVFPTLQKIADAHWPG
ncbi:MAG: inositol monophosphatase family protein [Paracoccaceae bacterium]|nr:inositol monophosphatase family protein [Paracoccaceae bacterium]